MMKHLFSALFMGIALSAAPVSAQPSDADREAAAEQIQKRIEETSARLKLTDEQKPQVEAILRESAEKRQAILQDFGFEEGKRPNLRPRQKRDLRGQLNAVSEETTEKLSAILTDAQIAEYEVIKEEQSAAMRERIQSR